MDVYRTVGRRKSSVARVHMSEGSGKMDINGDDVLGYFKRATLKMVVEQPLVATEMLGKVDIKVNVRGGGLSGQAGALVLGIARGLEKMNPDFRTQLKSGGFLTRDPREKERKKYGLAKARKRFQFSKR
jgi:small subunit ribosomal protein S9